jgi:sarcosine oxidase subunit beta
MRTSADAVVVGAGVIGCAIALELSRADLRVLVIDSRHDAGTASTSASSAVVRFNYSTWEGVAVAWSALAGWRQWSDYLAAPASSDLASLIETGGLAIEAPTVDNAQVSILFERAAVPFSMCVAADIREIAPAIDPGRFGPPRSVDDPTFADPARGTVAALYTPDAGFVTDPQLAAANLRDAAVRAGAVFRMNSTVIEVRRHADRVTGVTLGNGEIIDSPIIVNAAGPHSRAVNEMADALDSFIVTTRPLRAEVHSLPAPPGYGLADRSAPFVSDPDLGIYFRPHLGGTVIVGGIEADCDPLVWADQADVVDHHPTTATWNTHVMRLGRRLPDLRIPSQPRGIAHLYDVSSDWIPIYDRTDVAGYYVAIGTSGNQFKNAPVVGHLMRALIVASEDGHDHDATPLSMALPWTGLPIHLGHYSRKRSVHGPSSRSVLG